MGRIGKESVMMRTAIPDSGDLQMNHLSAKMTHCLIEYCQQSFFSETAMRTILTFSVLILAFCIGCPQPAPVPNNVAPPPDATVAEPDDAISEPDVAGVEPEVVISEPDVAGVEPEVVISEPEGAGRVVSVVMADLGNLELTFDSSWTIFGGPNRDGRSPETGLLQSWSEGGPPLLWKAIGIGNTRDSGYSSVTVADGRVFTAGNVGDDAVYAYVFALDEATGAEIWRYRNGPGWTNRNLYPGERSTPTIDGDRVYVYSAVGRVACLDAATGQEIWARDLRAEFNIQLPTWAFAESPYVDGNKVILWIGSERAAVVALNKMTGETIWETPGNGMRAGYATMTAFDHGGQRMYVNTNQRGILGVSAETGAQLFHIEHETAHDILATTPYFFDGNLFFTSGYGAGARLYRLNVDGDTITPERVWANNFDNQHHGVVFKDGYAYGSIHGGRWMCVRLADGEIVWENPGVRRGSITYADGMLYCTSDGDRYVALVRATPEGYQEVSRFQLPDENEGGGVGIFWAHPVVVNQKLFLRHGNTLYCFDVAER